MCTGISRGRGVEMRMRRVLCKERRGTIAERNRLYMVMAGALVGCHFGRAHTRNAEGLLPCACNDL